MSQSTLTSLQELASNVKDSKDINTNIVSLTKAFELFSKETARLELAYESLQKKFLSVNLELDETNKKLQNKVFELDTITAYLQNILNNISQGMIFIDDGGVVTTYNPASEHILGLNNTSVLFHPYSENFDDGIFGFSMNAAMAKKKAPEHSVITFTTPEEDEKDLEIDVSFVDHGMIILIRDVTKVRKLQKMANQNNRMKELGEMAASVAHEIRNPLGGIEGYASLLQRDLKGQENLQDMTKAIITGVRSLNKLVTDVLHYAVPFKLNLQNTNINDLILESVKLTKADTRLSKSTTIITELPKTPLYINVDKELIKSALLNLIVNGIQSMTDENGTLSIKLSKTKNLAILKITDTGKGISQKNLEKIFSPFFTTKQEGSGIGLSEVHKIMRAHA